VTWYEVLGVPADATTRHIRQAYVLRARREHPDFHSAADARTRATSEARMRDLNEAWAVLGDPARRAAYDASLRGHVRPDDEAVDDARTRSARPTGAADPDFVPYDDGEDVDYAALLDDAPTGNGATVPRAAQILPAVLFGLAVFCMSAGLFTSLGPMFGLGVVLLVLSGVSFVLIPMLAVMRSLQSDRD
jgi:curved DNA-binding protein CbpA